MKPSKIILQAGVMASGLILVLITLSGTTRTIGIWAAILSIGLFIADGLIDDSLREDDE
jgi:hypothetical protein